MNLSDPFAPSSIAYENLETPREMTQSDIEDVKEAYRQSVRRAMEAGFDGVEIHNAHGYLLSQFLSPAANKRTDDYGGMLENRSRLLFELVDIAKNTMPINKILSLRFGACDMIQGGLKLSEGVQVAKALETKGVDLLNVSVGIPQSELGGSQTRKLMNFSVLSAKIKEAVGIPVAVAGKIVTKDEAEFVIENGKSDLVALCRAILGDPLWPKKATGELDKPFVKCLGCLPRCSNYSTGCPLKK
jgi:2,4-dienoyl-CoA reductase-like NADH-dependent reductase (Old Yellow Enzyme family)